MYHRYMAGPAFDVAPPISGALAGSARIFIEEGNEMQSNAALKISSEEEATPYGATTLAPSAPVLVHVRFRPDATIWQIGERPDSLDDQKWFERLCARVGDKYEARAGGRGFFRLTRQELDSLKAPLDN